MNDVGSPASYAEQGLLPLRDLLVSDEVNEVVINPDRGIWVEHAGEAHMRRWDGAIPAERLTMLGTHLAGETKNQLGPHHPIVSGRVHVFGQSMRATAHRWRHATGRRLRCSGWT